MGLAGWVARLRYRSLGGAVPAAQPPTRCNHLGFTRALSQSPKGLIFSGTRVVVLPFAMRSLPRISGPLFPESLNFNTKHNEQNLGRV
jgi:hypothetical protein